MGLMICENAGKCSAICNEKTPHEECGGCKEPCSGNNGRGIRGSSCIPYIQPAKIGDEWNNRPSNPIAPLTDHAKYCRLSKQAGGLCGRKSDSAVCIDTNGYVDIMLSDWTQCPRPEKQQPVELPKPDPLEELINKYYSLLAYKGANTIVALREFADKVRAL